MLKEGDPPQQSPSPPPRCFLVFVSGTSGPHQMLLLSVIAPSRGGAQILVCSSCRSSRDGPGADTVCGTWLWKFEFFHSQPRRLSPGYHEAGGQGLPPPSASKFWSQNLATGSTPTSSLGGGRAVPPHVGHF